MLFRSPAQVQTIDAIARTITITGAGSSMIANVYATVSVSDPISKTKTFIRPNTLLVDPASSGSRTNSIFSSGNNNVYVSPLEGQTIINDTNLIQKKPGLITSLYVADVYSSMLFLILMVQQFQLQTMTHLINQQVRLQM